MKEDDTQPLEAVTDEVMEARIVAWVLGEASAFEIAELERLCGEQPELEVFRRRMLALQGLLVGTMGEEDHGDAEWKLSENKRQALDETLGGAPMALAAASMPPQKKKRPSWQWMGAATGIAASLVSALIVWRLYMPQNEGGAFGALGMSDAYVEARSPGYTRDQLDQAIQEQEKKVQASRKELSRIVRDKEIVYRGSESIFGGGDRDDRIAQGNGRSKDEAEIARGVDTSDFVASKRQYEAAMDRLAMLEQQAGGMRRLPGMAGAGSGPATGQGMGAGDAFKAYQAPADAVVKAKPRARVEAPRQLADNAPPPVAAAPVTSSAQGDMPDAVRRGLYMAEGNYNLGKYGDAKKQYEEVLRNDPYNTSARRGLERLASANSDYYRAAYDHTRAELLAEVGKAWELSVPADAPAARPSAEAIAPAAPASGEPPVSGSKMENTGSLAEAPAEPATSQLQQLGSLYYAEGAKGGESMPLIPLPGLDAIVDSKDFLLKEEKSVLEKTLIEEQNFDEIHTAEEAFSTFSLSVSDVSFQLAKAALERGGQPEPDSIKVEQFYNAVDYGDPSPESNEPVAGVVEQSAHPVIPGRNLVRLGIRTAAAGRGKLQPLRLTLLIDQSGSMVREDRKAAMIKAIDDLSGLLGDTDQVSVIGFSRTPKMLMESTPGKGMGGLKDLINPEASEGGTNLEEAMKLARTIASRHKLEGAQNRIVLFTDGAANLGDADPQRLSELVKAMRQQGLAFDVAGIGADGLNDQLLANLARHGNGRYYVAADNLAAQLAGAFRPAAEDMKVQVKFNPGRVSRYKLIGFEESRLKTEDFRNDSVDAAEISAEEAAVAVYQVELIPGGQGVIGEMNVRFRDVGSGEIVERGWTIPHDDATPAFDRASPSIQLAGLSMLAGQKLQGGPLADAIHFKDLTTPIARVRQYYSGSNKVSDMLRVIGLLSK